MTYATTTTEPSPRERQILALWLQGMSYQSIADLLSTPEKIVKKGYVNKALDNLQFKRDMQRREELRTWAMEKGYDKVEEPPS